MNNGAPRSVRLAERWQISRLFGIWSDILKAEGLTMSENDEREARLRYSSEKLGVPVESWSKLTRSQAGELIALMLADRDGDKPHPVDKRLQYVAWLAPRLYGDSWDELLHERLTRRPYNFYGSVDELTARKLRSLIEEMLERIARANITAHREYEVEALDFMSRAEYLGKAEYGEKIPSVELRTEKEKVRHEMIVAGRR